MRHYVIGETVDPETVDLDDLAEQGLVMTPRGKIGVVVPCQDCPIGENGGCFWCDDARRLIHFGGVGLEPLHERVVP